MRFFKFVSSTLALLIFSSCASDFLKYEKSEELKDIKEFEHQVKIDAPELSTENEKRQSINSSLLPPVSKQATDIVKLPTNMAAQDSKTKPAEQKKK